MIRKRCCRQQQLPLNGGVDGQGDFVFCVVSDVNDFQMMRSVPFAKK